MAITQAQRRQREILLSQDYADFIVAYGGNTDSVEDKYQPDSYEIVNSGFMVIHKKLTEDGIEMMDDYSYNLIPEVFGLLDTTSMEESGILSVHDRPGPGYLGQGVLVGVIDTGIDYTHPAFKFSDGTSRILSIWDQTIQSDQVPESFPYGTLYTQEELNRALKSDAPFESVPSRDLDGHGTFMAGIMAGSRDAENDFIGAAPEASIVVVKLKPAKEYLREYYVLPQDALAYQETDVFMAIQHLINESVAYQMPLVICLGIGNTLNSHEGTSNLSQYLNAINNLAGLCVVIAAGNELGRAHHYSGFVAEKGASHTVELKVSEQERGFQMEIWGGLSDVFSIEIISPEGERITRGQSGFGQPLRVKLLFEETEIFIANKSEGLTSGRFLMVVQLRRPTPGIWTFRLYGENIINGNFDVWLPMEKFMNSETIFLNPDPDQTVTSAATTSSTLTIANYNHYNDSLYVRSSRGYTSSGIIKPDITAPGVNVYGPVPGGRYDYRTGSSVSAAHAAGAAALLLEWGLFGADFLNMDGSDVRRMLILGADQNEGILFPNKGWGYGTINLQNTFETLRMLR